MSDTFFTTSPHWGWYIVLYFFVGGIAGGAMFLASCLRLFGRAVDRPVMHLGHYLAVAGAAFSGLLLTVDLSRPERFWRMLTAFKAGSPMSVGAWVVMLFSLVASLAALASLTEEKRVSWRFAAVLGGRTIGSIVAVVGGLLGLFLAGYTGVLLAVTNRPLWADSTWLGVLFLFSGLSTAAAALVFLGRRRGAATESVAWLLRFDRRVILLEAVALVAFLGSLGSLARVFVGGWGLLLLGTIALAIVAPLWLEARRRRNHAFAAPLLVLAGGLLLRVVVIFSSSGIEPIGTGVAGR